MSSEFTRDYAARGYAIARGAFTAAEAGAWRQECNRLVADPAIMSREAHRTVTRESLGGGKVVDRLDPVIDVSPVLAALVRDPRLLGMAAELLGEEAVLLKDKLIFKGPGVHGYTVHQDYTAWQEMPVPASSVLSLMVAIDRADAENGGVEFFPGLHHEHYAGPGLPEDLFAPESGTVPEAVLAGTEPEVARADPGDIVAIHSLAPHRSAPNRTTERRAALFLTYSAKRHGDLYDDYYAKFRGYRQASIAARSL
ncbi:phytanoyl-CoA dioxygenase family protein [Lolliginicoccus levis]|uniref:phytanoyl-CoA dioxygenase family protein n=1 Tax=Lolliginicoccus levis TaxID=2919542 RepID=UPI00241FC771|nr:phytanoyl-CoA dioxygenase family protein [Lolliginicoccus levis]